VKTRPTALRDVGGLRPGGLRTLLGPRLEHGRTGTPNRHDRRDIESIEESGVDPTLELIEKPATALESDARIVTRATPGFHFEAPAA
jgi:hypothetical protein